MDGYSIVSSKCQIVNCKTIAIDGTCTECNLGYEKNTDGFCSPKNCKLIEKTTFKCHLCNDLFQLTDSTCVPTNCKTLNTTDGHLCDECNPNYIL